MRCSHCGVCCEETEMLLSKHDIKRLQENGYSRLDFTHYDKHGYARLRNRKGFCVFYDAERKRCRIYSFRPIGCRIYPVVCTTENEVIVDELCPMHHTISSLEMSKKAKQVLRLLRRIDREARQRGR